MKTLNEAYIGLDLHTSQSVIAVIDQNGHKYKRKTLPTEPARLQSWIDHLSATRKQLAVEEGSLTQWMSWQLRRQVDKLVVCDPKQNYLISRSARKSDGVDAEKLARLLRLGELAPVWHPSEKNQRALFAEAASHYLAMRKHQVRIKCQLKALYNRWGVLRVEGEQIYSKQGRQAYLAQVKDEQIHQELKNYYGMMDQAEAAQAKAESQLYELGEPYPEITEFKKMWGVGQLGAHLFSALIQTPHRFATAGKLWRWSKLAITDRGSNGKPLGFEKLDPNGRSEIKTISYRAWKAATGDATADNEVKAFYEASLKRTGNATHARLNTQRKILNVLWTVWKKQLTYDPQRF